MAKVRDLLAGSLRLIGVLDPGDAMDAATARDALQALNDLIESLNLEHLTNPRGKVRVDVACTAGQGLRTIGTGGNFDVARPVVIEEATVMVGGYEHPVEVVEADRWAAIPDKTRSGIPTTLYYDPAAPIGQVHLYPVPNQAYAMALWVWDSLPTYTSINETLILPPGYARMYRYNLALELASEWGRDIPPAVIQIALDAKAAIKRVNQTAPLMECDLTSHRGHGSISAFLAGD